MIFEFHKNMFFFRKYDKFILQEWNVSIIAILRKVDI